MYDKDPQGGEFVSPAELARVFDLAARWLLIHGDFTQQKGIVTDELGGLPVLALGPADYTAEEEKVARLFLQPYYELSVPKSILDVYAPGVSETFGLSGNLGLSYYIPCYEVDENGELEYATPVFSVSIPKPEGGEITEDGLMIIHEEDGSVASDRETTTREGGPYQSLDQLMDLKEAEKTGEVSDSLREHLSAKSFAERTGLDHITKDELDAIEKVFAGLTLYYEG